MHFVPLYLGNDKAAHMMQSIVAEEMNPSYIDFLARHGLGESMQNLLPDYSGSEDDEGDDTYKTMMDLRNEYDTMNGYG